MKPQPKKDEPERVPGVEVGDDIYFQHDAGPAAGRVLAHGKHGCTVDHDGEQRRVTWDRVHGHKRRAVQRYTVLDEGEDGMIVEDAAGQRRYISIPPESDEDPMVTKSFGGQGRVLLLLKADKGDGPKTPRAGLTRKQIVDRTGRKQTKWVRAGQEPTAEHRHAAPESGAAHGYGTHNLRAGDTVNFKAGDFEGTGQIVGEPGADGAHVKDESGRTHQVRWSEITGHDKNGANKPKFESLVRGKQDPIPADKFNASAYAKEHDDPDVTPDSILAHFPPDTKEKIADVQERLKSIEQTIDQHKDGDEYTAEREKLHREIFKHFLNPERILAASPPEGEKPTFTMLGGRGGSGKSWFKHKVYDPNNAIVLDADEIKGMLPEYEGWNAHQVHEESSEILDKLQQAARSFGVNIVLDATMKTAKGALAKVKEFKDAGYRIEAHYMHLPRQEAAKRAVSRFLGKTNRYVPASVVLSNTSNEDTFDQVRRHADRWSFHDNNVAQGQEPIKISEGGGEVSKNSNEGARGSLHKSLSSPILMLWRK